MTPAIGLEPLRRPFRVGDWLAEPAWNRIGRNGRTVKLEPRVMSLLATLAAAPARPLTRRQLLDAVWPDTLVNEEALSRAVSQLRRALGDDPKSPVYLKTVHKGGYCLIAPVRDAEAAPEPLLAAPAAGGHRLPVRALLLLLVGGLALAGALLHFGSSDPPQPVAPRSLVPLTTEPGREIDPAVSPDGRSIAYLASSAAGYQLFVRDMEGGGPVRLTQDRLAKGHLAWSPTGDRIAFVGADRGSAAIYLQPTSGGAASKLIELPSWSYGLDWSPDGRMLAYSDAGPGEAAAIVLLDIATRAARPLPRSEGSSADVKPSFSPDGRRLAFLRSDPLDRQQVAVVSVAGGPVTILTAAPQQLRGLDWSPDGKSVIVAGKAGRRFGLWRLAADGSREPEALPADGGDLFNPSVARDGRVVVEEVEQDRDIWRADITGSSAPLIRSTADDYEPAFAPQGTPLAFVSERSGAPEIWIEPPSAAARRLTNLAGPAIWRLAWSPDGRRIAFAVERSGASSIHVVAAAGAEPALGLKSSSRAVPIGWTADGKAVVLMTEAGAHWRLDTVEVSSRIRRRMSALLVRAAAVAADGSSIFAVPAGENKLLHIAPAGGIVRQYRLPNSSAVAALLPAEGALLIVEGALGTAVVRRIDLATGALTTVAKLEDYGGGAPSLYPDGRSIVYTRARETANDLAWTRL